MTWVFIVKVLSRSQNTIQINITHPKRKEKEEKKQRQGLGFNYKLSICVFAQYASLFATKKGGMRVTDNPPGS